MDIPNTASAKKHVRQSAKRRERNLAQRGAFKTSLKKFKKAVEKGDKSAAESLLPELMKTADKAAKNNVIHPRKAARIKSRLMKKLQAKA